MITGDNPGIIRKNLDRRYRINHQINVPQVRLLAESGEMLGVMATAAALQQAKDQGVDLVEITASANPPVAKLIDYKKFIYQEERKQRQAQKNVHRVEMKELWMGPLMGDHDLQNRVNRGKEFLSDGDHVKFTIRYSGREMAHREIGYKVIDRVKELLSEVAEVEKEPVFLGRQLSIQFKPKK